MEPLIAKANEEFLPIPGPPCERAMIATPSGNDRYRRIADVADHGLGRLNWADINRWPNGGNGRDGGRTRVTKEALVSARSRS